MKANVWPSLMLKDKGSCNLYQDYLRQQLDINNSFRQSGSVAGLVMNWYLGHRYIVWIKRKSPTSNFNISKTMHYNSISPGATTINASQGIAFFRQ
jgi:hypothetical protein